MRLVFATLIIALSCVAARADELNDMPDLACAQASSGLERTQIGCPDTNPATNDARASTSRSDRSEDR